MNAFEKELRASFPGKSNEVLRAKIRDANERGGDLAVAFLGNRTALGKDAKAAFTRLVDLARRTISLEVSEKLENDGRRFETLEGETLDEVCESHGGRRERRDSETARWVFNDGSAIVVCADGWDVLHPDCSCGFCWAGVDIECEAKR